MQMESDGDYIIFTPTTDFDFFTLGRAQERCKKFEYTLVNGDRLKGIKVKKQNILDILLQD